MSMRRGLILYLKNYNEACSVQALQRNLEKLGQSVLKKGLNPTEMNDLLEVWLNNKIIVGDHWIVLCYCLIPAGKVEDRLLRRVVLHAVKVAKDEPFKVKFFIYWVSGLMDNGYLNVEGLRSLYDSFYNLFQNEEFSGLVVNFLYTLTTDTIVTRKFVLRLLIQRTKSKSDKMKRQIDALLWLFKRYWPEHIPEPVNPVHLHTVREKIDPYLQYRLGLAKDRRGRHPEMLDSVFQNCPHKPMS